MSAGSLRRMVMALGALAAATGCSAQSGSGAVQQAGAVKQAAMTRQAPLHFSWVRVRIPRANAGDGLSSGLRLRLPRGWRAEVWARVPRARLEAWTPQGDLLVSQPDYGQVTELVPRRNRMAPPLQRVIITGLHYPQGLAFARLNRHEVLYVAEEDAIDRYAWHHGWVGARRVIVSGLPDTAPPGSDNHIVKNIVVGPNGRIYIDIGSGSNATPPAPTNPPRAAVISYRPDGSDERIIATGVRNGDGLSFAPDGTLWSAINERDQISYPFHRAYGGFSDAYGEVIVAYVNNHPPDELARLTPGRNLGWPYCDPDPDISQGRAGTSLRYFDLPFIDDQQTNPYGTNFDCARLQPLNRGLPAHSAPLGFHFLEGTDFPARWRDGAVVAVHGSWDRQPPRPPAVLWLPWKAKTKTLGAPITLVGGFQYPNGSRWARAVDAVVGPDGALYVSDDYTGAILRIIP